MANTYTGIATTVLGSATTSVTFSSIPATYTDLLLRIYYRKTTGGGSTGDIEVRVNNNTGAVYAGITVANASGTTLTTPYLNQQNTYSTAYGFTSSSNIGGSASPNSFNFCDFYFANYQNTTGRKGLWLHYSNMNYTTNQSWNGMTGWNVNDSAAITSLVVTGNTDTLTAGSEFWLYGIKNS